MKISCEFMLLSPFARIPQQMTSHSAGFDLTAALEKDCCLAPGQFATIGTGIAIAIPSGYEAQIRPRSGLAAQYGIGVLNSPGTIDADYRGEIKVILVNHSDKAFIIKPQMRIAQMIVCPVAEVILTQVDKLPDTDRNSGGFGHTGLI